jgi:hypothetical protein
MINNETAPEQPAQTQREPSQAETAAIIADALGETAEAPRRNIVRIVHVLGRTQARALLAKTMEIEANGGIMLPDNSRRRTVGGIFFHLAYTTGQPKPGKTLERPVFRAKKPKNGDAQPKQANEKAQQQPATVFTWDDRIAIINEASTEKGNATTVKITLVGRPGKILDKGQFIVTVMESSKVPALPKGLPTPTNMTTKYAVYVAAKQWKKVADAIQDPEDALIIEGFPKIDPETSAIAVFTTNITTKKQQMAKKQSQPE